VAYLAEKKGKAVGKPIDCIPQAVMDRLRQHPWPGNVRELENVIERAIILSRDRTLSLAGVFGADEPAGRTAPPEALSTDTSQQRPVRLRDVDRAHILRVCEACGWRIKGPDSASVRLDLKPSSLYFRMKKLGITRPRAVGAVLSG
jgi:DNA-binding NtrC family response regulator